ncbi:MAG: enoyl-CoA hydratase/isomerase family protein [Proteobacteria bacterium]|nr:enoyl-CoA hydratase/isomerase family protein [Pseudomonadota bacterium]
MTSAPRFYEIEKDGPVVIWKFSNPPRNLATIETGEELRSLVEAFDKDPNLRVGIVTSAVPGMFIQHFDVSSIVGWAEDMSKASEEELAKMLEGFPPPKGIADYTSKIVICAINGPVQGGGCEMALSCDFRFISRDSFMGQPEVNAGIIPGGGGTQRLAKLLGTARAMELCLTGRRIYPDEAERLGLVTQACDPEDLMPVVLEFAKSLATKPPLAVSLIKQAINQGWDQTMTDGLTLERRLFFDSIRSEDALAIMRLYVQAGQDPEKLAKMMQESEE